MLQKATALGRLLIAPEVPPSRNESGRLAKSIGALVGLGVISFDSSVAGGVLVVSLGDAEGEVVGDSVGTLVSIVSEDGSGDVAVPGMAVEGRGVIVVSGVAVEGAGDVPGETGVPPLKGGPPQLGH